VRVVIAEDMALLRQGLARLLTDAGFDVAGSAGVSPEWRPPARIEIARTDCVARVFDERKTTVRTEPGEFGQPSRVSGVVHDDDGLGPG